MTDGSLELTSVAGELLASLMNDDGPLYFEQAALDQAAAALASASPEDRELVAEHLLAAALKVNRIARDNGDFAVSQLCDLVAEVLGRTDAAALFNAAGLASRARTAKLIGRAPVMRAPMVGAAVERSGFVVPRVIRR